MKTIKVMRVKQLTVVVLLTFAACAQASTRQPMGYYVREAGLIIVGDTQRTDEFDTLVSIKEVIKGESKIAGTQIRLNHYGKRAIADAYLPSPATNVTVLLREGWQDQKSWPVLEAYAKAKEAAAVRTLAEIYRLPDERDRLLALRDKVLADDGIYKEQLFTDLRDMRDPQSFDVMTDLFDVLVPVDQVKLVEIIGRTGDLRAVPTLLNAMQSSDEKVSIAALRALSRSFPGAPGVTDGFEKALPQKHLARDAARYLSKRRDVLEWNELVNKPETPWRRANRLWEAGDQTAARIVYMGVVEDQAETPNIRRFAATKLMPEATGAEKDRIRKALLPLLLGDARGDNYLDARQSAKILRGLQHSDCLEALLELISRAEWRYQRSARIATLAVCELGPEARRQAVDLLLENLEADVVKVKKSDERVAHLMKLIWLGDASDVANAEDILPAAWMSAWTYLRPFHLMAEEKDKGAFLVRQLARSAELPYAAREWVVFCLNDMMELRAVNVLVNVLVRSSTSPLATPVKDALINIGSSDVEAEMLKLMGHPDRPIRRAAVEVLLGIQGADACELSRRMLREDNFGLKFLAMGNLGRYGTVDDLALLLPYCDYWKADRDSHYWAMSAVSRIRERYNYDINGPIVKNSDKK